MKNPKIIYYSPHPTHDIVSEVGYATHQRETIAALRELGCEVVPVIMGGSSKKELKFETGKAFEATGLKKWIKKLLPEYAWISLKDMKLMRHDKKAAAVLEAAILEHKPDLVYERSEFLQNRSVDVIQKHGIAYFLEVNAPFEEEMRRMEGRSWYHKYSNRIERKKLDAAQKVFTVSSPLKKYLCEEFDLDAKKICVAPNRIDPGKFNPSGVDQALRVIGFVGSILPFHRLDRLLRAFALLRSTHPECALHIVGEGTQLQELKSLSIELNIAEHVQFFGKVAHDNVQERIAEMDICVMPGCNWYQSPVKIFEYGGMRKCIIAPDKENIRDVISDGEDGILVDPTVTGLLQGLEEMINDPIKAKEMATHFYEKVHAHYTWKHAGEEIVQDFFNVVENH